jgi:hypothetical protein
MPLSSKQKDVVALVEKLRRPEASKDELLGNLDHPVESIRIIAIRALSPLVAKESSLAPHLLRAYRDPRNQSEVLGGIKVAHLVIESLIRAGTPEAIELARTLFAETGTYQELVLRYLESEGLNTASLRI